MLDKFFLKYEKGGKGGVKLIPPGKTTLRKPSLIRVKVFIGIQIKILKIFFILWNVKVLKKLFFGKNNISDKNHIKLKNNTINNKMFFAVFISGSYEFCSDGKGSLYTLHVGYFKRHGYSHTRRMNRQACFDKEVNENRWKISAHTSSVWSLACQKKYFAENYESFSEERL